MRATFRQLETFLLIAREGSFAAAAKHLGISQAAISKQVTALERAMGGAVFERRSGSSATLNARGRLLMEGAPELVEKAQQLTQKLRRNTTTIKTVRVAADDVLLETVFYPTIGGFYQSNFGIQIEFVECEPALESVTAMSKEHIDLAYFTLSRESAPASGQALSTSIGCLFASPRLPGITAWRNNSPEPLPMIMALAGSKLERSFRKTLAGLGITNYRVAAHIQHGNSMRDLAIQGIGACLLSRHRAAAAVREGKLVELSRLRVEHALGRYQFRNPLSQSRAVDAAEKYLSGEIIRRTNAW